MEFKGIRGEEKLPCGCKIKWYKGGKWIQTGCDIHAERVIWKCVVCSIELSHRDYLDHRWMHAY